MESDSINRITHGETSASESQNSSLDFTEFVYPGTTHTVKSELAFVMAMLASYTGAKWMVEKVYPALLNISDRFVEMRVEPTDCVVTRYCDLLALVKGYSIGVLLSEASIRRHARSLQVAETHHVIFAELDRILDILQVPSDDPVRTWEVDNNQIDQGVLHRDDIIQGASFIGRTNEAVTLTHPESQNRSPLWDSRGRPVLSNGPPPWYLPLRDVQIKRAESIGKGAFGTVYKGTWLNTPVAIKFMGYEEDDGTVSTRLFLHEVRVWHQLDHPHIIKLFGANHVDKRYFVCEFASNGDLLAYLKRNNSSSKDKWKKMYEVALGLHYMHLLNIVHNDLKCNNILVGENGEAKIIDFGLSCIPGEAEIKVDSKVMGAVHWKSPEYLRGERPSIEADIYSLAMCILEALTGERPWGNNMLSEMVPFHVNKGRIPNRPAMMTDKQWSLIELMTKPDPTERVKTSFVVDKLFEIVKSHAMSDVVPATQSRSEAPNDSEPGATSKKRRRESGGALISDAISEVAEETRNRTARLKTKTASQRAMKILQKDYTDRLPTSSLANAFDITLDESKAKIFEVMESSLARDTWLQQKVASHHLDPIRGGDKVLLDMESLHLLKGDIPRR
ncbi:Serine/threonine protein kinase, partial [Globisporangium splendens]